MWFHEFFYESFRKFIYVRDHPFKMSANFSRFLTPTLLLSADFYYYLSANLANFWPLHPKNCRHMILHGWSLSIHSKLPSKRYWIFRKYSRSTRLSIVYYIAVNKNTYLIFLIFPPTRLIGLHAYSAAPWITNAKSSLQNCAIKGPSVGWENNYPGHMA